MFRSVQEQLTHQRLKQINFSCKKTRNKYVRIKNYEREKINN